MDLHAGCSYATFAPVPLHMQNSDQLSLLKGFKTLFILCELLGLQGSLSYM
jgi:hypothetical protein